MDMLEMVRDEGMREEEDELLCRGCRCVNWQFQ